MVTSVMYYLVREGTYETLFTQPEKLPEVIKEKKVRFTFAVFGSKHLL